MDIIPYGHFTLWTICRFTSLENHIANEHKEKLGLNIPPTPMINNVKPLPEQPPMSSDFEPQSCSQDGPLIESPNGLLSCSPELTGLSSGPPVLDGPLVNSTIPQSDGPMDLSQENVDVEMKELKLQISSDQSNEKPKLNYVQLIEEALVGTPDGMLTAFAIFKAISSRHPYYKLGGLTEVKMSNIRHNLTLKKCFTKADRTKGGLWKLTENNSGLKFQQKIR